MYEDMTDFEINKAVASELGIYWHSSPSNNNSKSWLYSDNYNQCNTSKGEVAIELPDYCNSPSDAWPIILESNISVVAKASCDHEIGMYQFTGEWSAEAFTTCDGEFGVGEDVIENVSENPLRASMIVYLKAKAAI